MTVGQVLTDTCANGQLCPNGQLLWQALMDAEDHWRNDWASIAERYGDVRFRRRLYETHVKGCHAHN